MLSAMPARADPAAARSVEPIISRHARRHLDPKPDVIFERHAPLHVGCAGRAVARRGQIVARMRKLAHHAAGKLCGALRPAQASAEGRRAQRIEHPLISIEERPRKRVTDDLAGLILRNQRLPPGKRGIGKEQ
jgi:hypothetical protein